jgi:hypothetical protein
MTVRVPTIGVCPDAARATLDALWEAMGRGTGTFGTPAVPLASTGDHTEPPTHWGFQDMSATDAEQALWVDMATGVAMPTLPSGVEYGENGVPSIADATAACLTMALFSAAGDVPVGWGMASALQTIGLKIRPDAPL